MNYLQLLAPAILPLAKKILRKLGRSPLEVEYGEALIAAVIVAEKQHRGTDSVRDYAITGKEFGDVLEKIVHSKWGEGGVTEYYSTIKALRDK